ncbi:MAG: UvrD-helicase domain-containing protein, partial [Flavobacteriales bacterium]|nr:UvrD-helicase domain-containing protein [Flavobacteriales bacterium]
SLIKTILKEKGLDDKLYKPNIVYNRISAAKNNLIGPKSYLENPEIMGNDESSGRPKIGEIYQTYNRRCFKSGAMDFDYLLFKTNVLLTKFPDVLYKYQHKFKHVLVDEYQDTNHSQYSIVKKLAALNENVCVVGDDAQSIYSFRGANIQNILNFKKDYPDYTLIKLEQNYRSTKAIVNAANSIIGNNRDQIAKEIWTENQEGQKISVKMSLTDNEEGFNVASSIHETNLRDQVNFNDFAILYRTNAQSRSMEEALRRLNIAYRVYGGLSFYQRKEIKDLMAYFRMAINPNDEEALKRVINYPARGIGKTSIDKLIVASSEMDRSIWQVLLDINHIDIGINTGTRKKIQEFVTLIKTFSLKSEVEDAYKLGMDIANSSGLLKDLYNDRTPEGLSKHENIQELLNGIKDFTEQNEDLDRKTLASFTQDIALLTDADSDDKEPKDRVSLMTIHSSKGLEFPHVYIVGLEENLFPSQLSINSRAELEEERRLFYVAVTRAMTKAYLSYATTRYRWGSLINCEPSRFIEEIDERYIEKDISKSYRRGPLNDDIQRKTIIKSSGFQKKEIKEFPSNKATLNKKLIKVQSAVKSQKTNSDFKESDLSGLAQGMKIEHERFGRGIVIKLEGEYPNTKASVEFEGVGKKQLLLKFAKLRILN